ncbi:MAG: transketolase C-terminal domain-containing protein, partial [Oscillospiraceae bacterium]|nr:transketolase C-terminal domain-containing protein [Oscillospiraceae bacterium]MDD4546810.1 transketolase C-terminal domain-containing protein [Oscillospiraceae bacterium]
DTYRNPVMVLADGILGQMMESLNLSTPQPKVIDKGWATTGTDNIREHNIINSLYIKTDESEQLNLRLQSKYEKIKQTEQRYEITNPDADIMLVAFGITSRIAKQAVEEATSAGLSVGLLRPQTVWPFPSKAFEKIAKAYLTVELNSGQMIEDVKLEVNGRAPVHFLGKMGGAVLSVDEILSKIKEIAGGINNAG